MQGVTPGAIGLYTNDGAPVDGTDAVQTITVETDSNGGTYRLQFEGFFTAELSDASSAADVQAALEALASIGSGNVSVDQDSTGAFLVTFEGDRGKKAVGLFQSVREDNVTVTIEETTPGVDATVRGAGKGSILTDTANGTLYIQTGTSLNPAWVVVGSQS